MPSHNQGTLDRTYAQGRGESRALRYRLQRRTHEVISAIKEFAPTPVRRIVDLGTADSRMLGSVQVEHFGASCLGIELNKDLAAAGAQLFPPISVVQGDIQALALGDNSYDVAIATAVVEHVPNPQKVMREIKRILRPGGIAVITSPDPFWERLATFVGHLKDDQHQLVMNLPQLKDLALNAGFTILIARKFMLSPIGVPGESFLEDAIRFARLHFLLANQLLIIRA